MREGEEVGQEGVDREEDVLVFGLGEGSVQFGDEEISAARNVKQFPSASL